MEVPYKLPIIVEALVDVGKFEDVIHIADIDKSLKTKYDLIYIENMIESTTLDTVIELCLKCTHDWGLVVVAQTLPNSPALCLPGGPCGNAWASIYWLRMNRDDLTFRTLEQDYGYTVIYKRPSDKFPQYPLSLSTWNTKRDQIMLVVKLQDILDLVIPTVVPLKEFVEPLPPQEFIEPPPPKRKTKRKKKTTKAKTQPVNEETINETVTEEPQEPDPED